MAFLSYIARKAKQLLDFLNPNIRISKDRRHLPKTNTRGRVTVREGTATKRGAMHRPNKNGPKRYRLPRYAHLRVGYAWRPENTRHPRQAFTGPARE